MTVYWQTFLAAFASISVAVIVSLMLTLTTSTTPHVIKSKNKQCVILLFCVEVFLGLAFLRFGIHLWPNFSQYLCSWNYCLSLLRCYMLLTSTFNLGLASLAAALLTKGTLALQLFGPAVFSLCWVSTVLATTTQGQDTSMINFSVHVVPQVATLICLTNITSFPKLALLSRIFQLSLGTLFLLVYSVSADFHQIYPKISWSLTELTSLSVLVTVVSTLIAIFLKC